MDFESVHRFPVDFVDDETLVERVIQVTFGARTSMSLWATDEADSGRARKVHRALAG
jgi:hypothetical protein